MNYPHFGGRVRAALIGGGASLAIAAATLSGTAMAADQTTTTAAPQTPQALTAHTHQIHGVVSVAPAATTTSTTTSTATSTAAPTAVTFTLHTVRYGDVVVSFAGRAIKGEGHGKNRARAFELAKADSLKVGDRVVAQGRVSTDGKTFVARRLHVIPSKADKPQHLVGTISAVAAGTNGATNLTLTLADNSTKTVAVNSDTKIRPEGKTVADLKVGTKVTVVSKNGIATGVAISS